MRDEFTSRVASLAVVVAALATREVNSSRMTTSELGPTGCPTPV